MSDLLDMESPELSCAAYLRQLAAEADGVEMLPGPRGNRLRSIAELIDAWDASARVAVVSVPSRTVDDIVPGTLADLHARTFGGG